MSLSFISKLINKENVHFSDFCLSHVTKIEFDLLLYFFENINQVLSRDMILNALWNFEYDGDTRIVDVHVFKLKTKMKTSLLEFKSIRGIGYQLEVTSE